MSARSDILAGLLALFGFGESSSPWAAGNNGTITLALHSGTPSSTASGRIGNGVAFDGTDDELRAAKATWNSCNVGTGESFVFAGHFKSPASTATMMLGGRWGTGPTSRQWQVYISGLSGSRRVNAEVINPSGTSRSIVSANGSVVEGAWGDFVFQVTRTSGGDLVLELWVNGVAVTAVTHASDSVNDDSFGWPLQIGQQNTGSDLSGTIDEYLFYRSSVRWTQSHVDYWRKGGAGRSYDEMLNAPGEFALTLPADGAVDVALLDSPRFAWDAASGATSYTIEVSTTSDFSAIVFSMSGITATNYTPEAHRLSPYRTYYWRVTAVNASGSQEANGSFDFRTALSRTSITPAGSPLSHRINLRPWTRAAMRERACIDANADSNAVSLNEGALSAGLTIAARNQFGLWGSGMIPAANARKTMGGILSPIDPSSGDATTPGFGTASFAAMPTGLRPAMDYLAPHGAIYGQTSTGPNVVYLASGSAAGTTLGVEIEASSGVDVAGAMRVLMMQARSSSTGGACKVQVRYGDGDLAELATVDVPGVASGAEGWVDTVAQIAADAGRSTSRKIEVRFGRVGQTDITGPWGLAYFQLVFDVRTRGVAVTLRAQQSGSTVSELATAAHGVPITAHRAWVRRLMQPPQLGLTAPMRRLSIYVFGANDKGRASANSLDGSDLQNTGDGYFKGFIHAFQRDDEAMLLEGIDPGLCTRLIIPSPTLDPGSIATYREFYEAAADLAASSNGRACAYDWERAGVTHDDLVASYYGDGADGDSDPGDDFLHGRDREAYRALYEPIFRAMRRDVITARGGGSIAHLIGRPI